MSSSQERATSPIESPPSSPLTELSRTPSPPPGFEPTAPPPPKVKKSVVWGCNQVVEIPNENSGKRVPEHRGKNQEKRIRLREEAQHQLSDSPPVLPPRRRRYQYKPLATPADIAARPKTRLSDLWFETRPVPAQKFTTLETNNRASSKRKSPSEDEDQDQDQEVEISTTSTSPTTKRRKTHQ